MTAYGLILAVFVLSLFAAGVNGVWKLYIAQQVARRDPKAILDERFAQGEIDEREYARRLSILQLGPPLMLPDFPDDPAPPDKSAD